MSIKVIEVVTFLTSHNLAGGGERISIPYATLSQRYDQLRCHGDSKYVQIIVGRVSEGLYKYSSKVGFSSGIAMHSLIPRPSEGGKAWCPLHTLPTFLTAKVSVH